MTRLAPLATPATQAVADEDRLAALDSYDILEPPPEEGFDDIVHLATLTCNVPVALVSFVDRNRQWFKARVDFPHCQTDLDGSVCVHALTEPDFLVIPDLTADPRTRNNPLVTGEPYIRFYAGVPLRMPDGQVLGTLCVIDRTSRPGGLTAQQADILRTLGRQVMALLELRRTIDGRDRFIAHRRKVEEQLGENAARLQISEAHWRGLFERLSEGFVIAELVRDGVGQVVDWRYLDVNAAWGELIGVNPQDIVGRTVREVLPGIEDEWVLDFARVVETGEPVAFTRQIGSLHRWYEGRAFPLNGDRFAVLFVEVTGRMRADMRRSALLELGDQLQNLTTIEAITCTTATIVGQALGVTRVGFGRLDADGEHVVVEPDWTADGISSIAGRHRFADYGDIRTELLLGEPLIVRDALIDPRTANDTDRWNELHVRALVNIPIQERGRTAAVFIVHDDKPRVWSPETVGFLGNVANRLMAAVAGVQAEEQQALLNQELSHRMKNMLAMIQAIARQTLKGVKEQDAVTSFQQRLLALSSAHDVLLQKSWAAAPIHDVVTAVLRASGQIERFDTQGPKLTLNRRASLSMSMLLHELATNAAKYGALSVEAGRVVVAWYVDDAAGELVFTWTETGGPSVEAPTSKGFGSRLIQSGLIGTGGVTLYYPPSGLEAEMRACLDRVRET